MIARPDPDLLARIQWARTCFHLSLAEMAEELRITPEWLSKLANGHHPPSYNIGLRFEAFLRERKVDAKSFGRPTSAPTASAEPNDSVTAAMIKGIIDLRYRRLLSTAGDDHARLCWIAERLAALMTVDHTVASKTKRQASRVATDSAKGKDGVSANGKIVRQRERKAFLRERFRAIAV
jgi:transcriptional regulator with XRE-family HTH domain